MTVSGHDLVEAFLEGLGGADVPAGLASTVGQTVRARGGPQGGRIDRFALLAAAAAVALIIAGLAIVGTRPQDLPGPSTAIAALSPSIQAVTQGPPATFAPGPVLGRWDLVVPLFDVRSLRLEVADQSGLVFDAKVAAGPPAGTVPDPGLDDDPFALDIRPVPDAPTQVWVGWSVLVCEYRARLTIDRSGAQLALALAPSPGCDLAPISQGVLLAFDRPIDADAMAGRQSPAPLFEVADLRPSAIAFSDALRGWIGGTTPSGDAVVLRTIDGGASWAVSGLGEGAVVELAGIDATHGFAARACGDPIFNCRGGTFRWDEDFGGWGMTDTDVAEAIDFAGDWGAMVARNEGDGPPVLRVNDDGGDTDWVPLPSPCVAPTDLPVDVERYDVDRYLVLCVGEGAGGSQPKSLLAAGHDTGWSEISSTGGGGLPMGGTGAQIDIHLDGTGWLWGTRMPLMRTEDGGATWTALDVADGDVRIVLDAAYLGGGAGRILVHDPDRSATLLLRTDAGFVWSEIGAWPIG